MLVSKNQNQYASEILLYQKDQFGLFETLHVFIFCDISVLFSQCIGLICFYMLPRRVVFFSVISVCVETGIPAVEIFTGALNCPHTLFLPLPFALALLNALTNS